ARLTLLRHELSGLVREVDHERGRFHQADAGVAVDDGGNAVVRTDLQELRLELLVLADVDSMRGIRQLQFLEQNGGFAAVGGGPGIEIDHGFGSCARTMAWLAFENLAGGRCRPRIADGGGLGFLLARNGDATWHTT